MKRLKLLWIILKRTKATQIILGFVLFLFANAAVIQLVEPNINRYGDALWYCYAVISTAGFGDFVTVTYNLCYFCNCHCHRSGCQFLYTDGRDAKKRNAHYVYG